MAYKNNRKNFLRNFPVWNSHSQHAAQLFQTIDCFLAIGQPTGAFVFSMKLTKPLWVWEMDDGRTFSMARTILALPACTATVVIVVVGASCSPTSEKPTSMATSLAPTSRCWMPPLTIAGPSTTGPSTAVGLRLMTAAGPTGRAPRATIHFRLC